MGDVYESVGLGVDFSSMGGGVISRCGTTRGMNVIIVRNSKICKVWLDGSEELHQELGHPLHIIVSFINLFIYAW